MTKEWYENESFLISEIENEETHITKLYGRNVDDGWEYAIVRFRYMYPTLIATFKNGEVVENKNGNDK